MVTQGHMCVCVCVCGVEWKEGLVSVVSTKDVPAATVPATVRAHFLFQN